MIILYHTHFNYIWETEIAVIVSLFIRLISCWKTLQNAGNSLTELQEIQNFLGGMPKISDLVDSVVSVSWLLSDLLPYDVYLVKPCIYMLVAAVI
jgi:hypothetical protein